MNSLYKLAIAAVVAGGMAAGASAATVQTTFDLSNVPNNEGHTDGPVVSLSQDGLKLTFSLSDSDKLFFADPDEIGVYSPEYYGASVTSFTLAFDHDVKLISYKYGYLQEIPDDLSLTLSGVNGSVMHSGDELDRSLKDFSTQFIAGADEALSFKGTRTSSGNVLVQLRNITVEWGDGIVSPASTVSAVPLPGSALALISGLGGLMALRGRRRNA